MRFLVYLSIFLMASSCNQRAKAQSMGVHFLPYCLTTHQAVKTYTGKGLKDFPKGVQITKFKQGLAIPESKNCSRDIEIEKGEIRNLRCRICDPNRTKYSDRDELGMKDVTIEKISVNIWDTQKDSESRASFHPEIRIQTDSPVEIVCDSDWPYSWEKMPFSNLIPSDSTLPSNKKEALENLKTSIASYDLGKLIEKTNQSLGELCMQRPSSEGVYQVGEDTQLAQ